MSEWQQRQFLKLTEFGEFVFCVQEADCILLHVDKNVCQMLGLEKEDWMAEERFLLKQVIHPSDWEDIEGQILDDLEKRGEYRVKFRVRHSDGTFFWVLALGEWENKNEDGHCVRSLFINVDEMETERREQKAVCDLVPGGVLRLVITKTDFYVQKVREDFYECMGISPDKGVRAIKEAIFGGCLEDIRRYLVKCAMTGEKVEYPFVPDFCGQGKHHGYWLIGHFYDVHRDGCEYQCMILKLPDSTVRKNAQVLEGQDLLSQQERRILLEMISKEFRTPLLHMERELRKHRTEEKEWKEFSTALRYMKKVVEDITDYEKLEKGKKRFVNRQFQLDHVLLNIFRTWEGRLKDSSVKIALNLNLQHTYYLGDLGCITQVLNHIIGNCAMAAGEESELHIWGDDTKQEGDISWLTVAVDGTGIPVSDSFLGRDYPMEGDYKLPAWKQGGEGTVFSLPVACRLAELLGGWIRLYRRDSQVNVVELTIPLQHQTNASDMRVVDINRTEMGTREGQGYHFLVLEGRKQNGHPVMDMLEEEGAKVSTAQGGWEAMEKWTASSPDTFQAILIDGALRDMEYSEFARRFRGINDSENVKTVPIIVITDRESQDVIEESIGEGVNVFVERTLDMKRLKLILEMMQGPFWQK